MAPEPRPPQPIQPILSLRLSGLPKVTVGKANAVPTVAAVAEVVFRKVRRVELGLVFIAC